MSRQKRGQDRIDAVYVACYYAGWGDFASFFEYGKRKARYVKVDKRRKEELVSSSYSYGPKNLGNEEVRQRIAGNLLKLADRNYGQYILNKRNEKRKRVKEEGIEAGLASLAQIVNNEEVRDEVLG